jgi:hypothetical protein
MLMRLLTSPILPYVAAGAIAAAAFGGWKVRDWQCDAAVAKALQQAEKNRAEMQEKIDGLSTQYEQERTALDKSTVYTTNTIREIYKTLPPVPDTCAPGPDVVRLLEGSIGSANAAAAGKSGE